MDEIQQSNLYFFLPLTIAYGLACATNFVAYRLAPSQWETLDFFPHNKWKSLAAGILTIIGVFVLGRLYTAGYLLPENGTPWYNQSIWIINNLIIYSPIVVCILLLKEPLSTIWVDGKGLPVKISVGMLAAILSTTTFLALRGEIGRFGEVIDYALSYKALSYLPAMFFEGVVIAFLFVRLKWVANLWIAISIPSLLFAYAHVPGMLSEGDPILHILSMSFVTGGIAGFVLWTCNKTKDVVWLALAHYLMDVAIKSF